MANIIEPASEQGAAVFRASAADVDKTRYRDGSIKTSDGTIIEPASEQGAAVFRATEAKIGKTRYADGHTEEDNPNGGGGGGANYTYAGTLSTAESDQPVTFDVSLINPTDPAIAVGNKFSDLGGNEFVVQTVNGSNSTANYYALDLTGAVMYSKSQSLSDAEKQTARENIGVSSDSTNPFDSYVGVTWNNTSLAVITTQGDRSADTWCAFQTASGWHTVTGVHSASSSITLFEAFFLGDSGMEAITEIYLVNANTGTTAPTEAQTVRQIALPSATVAQGAKADTAVQDGYYTSTPAPITVTAGADAAVGDTTLTVSDTTGILADAVITDGENTVTTVVSVDDGTTLTVTAITSAVTSGDILIVQNPDTNVSYKTAENELDLTPLKNGVDAAQSTANSAQATANTALQPSAIGVTIQAKLTIDSTPTDGSTNPVESGGVKTALDDITELIPATATADNKLVDTNFVNSTISTQAADPVFADAGTGIFATKAALIAGPWYLNGVETTDLGKNDWVTVSADETYDGKMTRYYYNPDGTTAELKWAFAYYVNTTSFTASQNAALNSGITAEAVAAIGTVPDGYISTTKLADGAVDQSKLAPNWYVEGTFVTTQLQANTSTRVGLTATGGDISAVIDNSIIIPETGIYSIFFPTVLSQEVHGSLNIQAYVYDEAIIVAELNGGTLDIAHIPPISATRFIQAGMAIVYEPWCNDLNVFPNVGSIVGKFCVARV